MEILKEYHYGLTQGEIRSNYVFPAKQIKGCYCMNCHSVIEKQNIFAVQGKILKAQCPHCHEVFYFDPAGSYAGKTVINGENRYRIYPMYNEGLSLYREKKLYYNGNKLCLFSATYEPEMKKKLSFQVIRESLCIDMQTFNAYYLVQRGNKKNAKDCSLVLTKDAETFFDNHMFSTRMLDEIRRNANIDSKVLDALDDFLFHMIDIDEWDNLCGLNFILAFKHIPNYCIAYDQFRELYRIDHLQYTQKYTEDEAKIWEGSELKDHTTMIQSICKKYKLPYSKSARQLYFRDSDIIPYFIFLQKCGFKDLNIMKSLISIRSFFEQDRYESNPQVTEMFLQAMVKEKGEAVTAVKLTKRKYRNGYSVISSIIDTARMYDDIVKSEPNRLPEHPFDGDVEEIHERMAIAHRKLDKENVPIPYTDRAKSLEDHISGYAFRLPKETDELLEIGDQMNNCVSAYRDDVLAGTSIILTAQDEAGNMRACMEVSDQFELKEAKAPYNRALTGAVRGAVTEWMHKHGIVPNCPTDLEIA